MCCQMKKGKLLSAVWSSSDFWDEETDYLRNLSAKPETNKTDFFGLRENRVEGQHQPVTVGFDAAGMLKGYCMLKVVNEDVVRRSGLLTFR